MKNYIGNPLQIRGAEHYTLQGGKGNGMNFLYIRNGLGIEAWISVDRAGDLSRVTFEGKNIGYFAPVGYVSPQYYDDKGAGFLKSFTGGFITTCGLSAVGSSCIDEGEELPLHGTVSNIPATILSCIETANDLQIELEIRDCTLFGKKFVMRRKYVFSYIENSIELSDMVTNEGDTTSPYMILYHCNIGYPLLSENSEVVINNNSMVARDSHADKYINTALCMEAPQSQYRERCYYFDVKEKNGVARVSIFNNDINKGLEISYEKENLPAFTEWKMMGKKDYVLGLEPGNCTPDGRDILRKQNRLFFLDPDKSKTTVLKFKFINDKTELK